MNRAMLSLRKGLMLLTLIGVWGLWACGNEPEATPLGVDPQFGKPAQDVDPTIDLVAPEFAPQDTTLDVTITGSGFETGSEVEWELDGTATPTHIKTNSARVANSKRIIANITISDLAQLTEYDVIVKTPRGKRGIGTERFRIVKKKGNTSNDPEVLSLTVEQFLPGVPLGLTGVPEVDAVAVATTESEWFQEEGFDHTNFFGCPDPSKPCNKIVTRFRAEGYISAGYNVQPVAEGCRLPYPDPAGGCVYAYEIENRRNLATFFVPAQPKVPFDVALGTDALVDNGDGSMTLTTYWQGQRVNSFFDPDPNVLWSFPGWSFYQAIGSTSGQYGDDRFVFFLTVRASDGSGRLVNSDGFVDCPPTGPESCTAIFQGEMSDQLYLVWDRVGFRTSSHGKGKKKTTSSTFSFELQAFDVAPASLPHDSDGNIDFLDPETVAASPKTWITGILTPPAGTGAPRLFGGTAGRNPAYEEKPEIAKATVGVTFEYGFGCYEIRLLDVFSSENDVTRPDQFRGSWDWSADGEIQSLRIDHEADGTTWQLGATCTG